MSDYKIKLGATLPKGDPNGFDYELAEELCNDVAAGRAIVPKVAVLVYDVKKIEIDADGTRTAVVRVRRVQPVEGREGLRHCRQILHDEYARKHGEVLPFDLTALSKAAFAELGFDASEQDVAEEEEREQMSPLDELRRHLQVVHGVDDASSMTEFEVETRHKSDHEPDVLPEGMRHPEDDHFWTRADIEARTSQDDDPDADTAEDGGTSGRQSDTDNEDHDGLPTHLLDAEEPGAGGGVVAVDFSGGARR